MQREAWNPKVGSMAASQWTIRKIRLEGFMPNADFAEHITCHPVECWLDDENCLVIASPDASAQDQLDNAEKRIRELEIRIKGVLDQHRLLNLVKKDDLELPF